MIKRMLVLCGLAAMVAAVSVFGRTPAHAMPPWSVTSAPEWTALFDRDSGWTGADGIYAIPISGDETPGSAAETVFVFSDTFIGEVVDNERQPGTIMVNNTLARLSGAAPDPNAITFYWGTQGFGSDDAIFVPDTPDANPGDWYWLMDGIAVDGTLYLYALRLESTGSGGMFSFAANGVALLSAPLDVGNPLRHVTQVDAPLFVPESAERGDLTFGGAIMPNTAVAGAPNPDGYLYIYGVQNDPFVKRLLAARVLPQHIADFDQYTYWDGVQWQDDIAQSAPVTSRVSPEMSMTPLPNGRFLLVFQRDTLSAFTAFRTCDSPVGPCGNVTKIYTCPEAALGMLCYNAKAHPHLSEPDKLLISYNVNTGFDMTFWDHFSNADIYRPRFLWLQINS